MPAMPNEKTTAVSLSERNFNELKLKGLTSSSAIVAATAAAAMATTAVTATIQDKQSTQQQLQQQKNNTCGCGTRYLQATAKVTAVTESTASAARFSKVRLDNNSENLNNNNNNNYKQYLNKNYNNNNNNSTNYNNNNNIEQQMDNNARTDSIAHRKSTTASINMTTTTKRNANGQMPAKKSANDFIFGKFIGEGSFSTVYLAVDVTTKKEYAIKVCEKRHILRAQKQEYIKRERELLHLMTNVPGFVNLSCTFQDARSLYFVMTYAKNGDLLPYINKVSSFDLDCTRHYAAELVLACEQMHSRNVVHRDLKPENILLDEHMHTLIADFGSAKLLANDSARNSVGCCLATTLAAMEAQVANAAIEAAEAEAEAERERLAKVNRRRNRIALKMEELVEDQDADESFEPVVTYTRKRKGSFVGTAQYVSPEVLNNGPITPAADLWALGCIIYQMIAGLPPFRGSTDYIIFKEILANNLDFPEGFDADAKDLVKNLLKLNPLDRLGALDYGWKYASIRSHPFFVGVDFDTVRQRTPPPIHPYLPGVSQEANDTDFSRTQYSVPENLEPGLDDRQMTRLLGIELGTLIDVTAIPVPITTIGGCATIQVQETTEGVRSDTETNVVKSKFLTEFLKVYFCFP